MSVMDSLAVKAKAAPKRIVFPEGANATIIAAAREAVDEGYAFPLLVGERESIEAAAARAGAEGAGISLDGIEVVEVGGDTLASFITTYAAETGFPDAVAQSFFVQPLFFAAMMVKQGMADAMVAGIEYATEDVIMASEMLIGTAPGIDTPSSFFLMDIPTWQGSEGSLLVFADCAVNPDPTPDQLADIAVATAQSARTLFGFDPRVALLSFSSKGSADHPHVTKVTDALAKIRERDIDFAVDGEFQADTAIVQAVSDKKLKAPSDVGGKANTLIFPDLDAGNIAYKLVQRLTGAAAYGPVLQGFAKPVSDLSRGATKEDVMGAIIMSTVAAHPVGVEHPLDTTPKA